MLSRIVVLSLVAGLFTTALPQAPTASLTGTVKDSSGAVVSGASITAVNQDTGLKRNASSNELGFYTLPLLPPGRYDVQAQLAGFRTVERKGIVLHVEQTITLDLTLEVGQLTETVTIQGETPLLQTAEASQGAVIENAKIVSLPLNGRNPFSLAALTPGVQPGGGFFTARVFQEPTNQANFTAAGGASFQNDILLDGTSNTVAGHGQLAMTPSVDAIEEFKVQTTNYSAEYGRTSGGIINIVTKSGTNQLRGTVYEFLRNKVLDAGSFFNNRAGIERQPFVYNQYGATSGGPVYLPKLYDGRNRTFFFVSYESVKVRRARYFNGTVPTEAERRGDFSGLRTANGQPILIYNPFSTRRQGTGSVRDPFPGNTIPAAMQDKVALNTSKYIPLPNQQTPTVARNFIANASQGNDFYTWQWRGDHNFNPSNRMFVRLSYDKQSDNAPNFYGNVVGEPATYGPSVQPDWHATVSDTHNFGPATLLDVRVGFARNGFDRHPRSEGFDPTQLGFPSALRESAQALQFPTFNIGGYSGVGPIANDKYRLGAETYSLVPQLTLVRGRHTMKIGGDYRILNHGVLVTTAPVGTYSFGAAFTQGPDPLRSSATAGDGYASMLLGATSGSAQIRASWRKQWTYSAAYFQDDIKLTSRLTLNLGLRYDYQTPMVERFNRLSFFDHDAINPVGRELGLPELRGGLKYVGVDGNPRGVTDPDRNNFAPRFGFAYQPFSKTAIRGGYGLTYLNGGSSQNQGGPQDGFGVATTIISSEDGGLTPFTLLSNAFADGLQRPTGSSLGMRTLLGQNVQGNPRWVREGYMQQWSLNVQRELPGQMLVETGYVGSRGVKLPETFQMNTLPDQSLSLRQGLLTQVRNPFASVVSSGTLSRPTVTQGQLLRPYPHFANIVFPAGAAGASTYHSFQMRVEKRFSAGLNLLAAYTNSKLISDTDGLKSGSWIPGEVSVGAQNPNNRRLERSVAPQDVSQRFVTNYIYELPFGKGKPLLASSGKAVSAIAGGWTLTGITTFQKGRPLNLSAPNNTNSYGGGSRPNSNGQSAELPSSERSLNRWFNTSVFSQPEPFTYGNLGRLLPDVREAGITNFDISVHRRFKIRERAKLEFRAEMFNAFNTPQFGRPNGSFGNVSFGTINSQANSPREIQFGLKLLY